MFYTKSPAKQVAKIEKPDKDGFQKIEEVNLKGQKITALSDLQKGQLMSKMSIKKIDPFQEGRILKVCAMIEAGMSDEKIERVGSPYCRRRVQDIRATLYPTKRKQ